MTHPQVFSRSDSFVMNRWSSFPFVVLEAPRFTDILPFKFANFLVAHQFFLPHLKRLPARLWSRGQPPSVEPDLAANEDDDLTTPIKSPVIRINDIVPEMATNRNAPAVTYLTSPDASVSSSLTNNQSADPRSSSSSRPWTDDDKQLLCRTIVRFPPGTPRRWERIAETIGRHVSQVTEMAKQIQNTVGSTNAAFQESHPSFASSTMIDQNIITERSPAESTSDWSQTDQQLLECALKTVPKDAPGADRWEQIARCIPGKSRDECLARYRHIVQLVRAKKTA